MLPTKWKIFRIINYLHVAGATGLMIFVIYMTSGFNFSSTADTLGFLLLHSCTIILLTNGLMNMYLLERCYPDKYPARRWVTTSIAIFILDIIVMGLVVYVSCYGFYEEFIRVKDYEDRQGKLLVFILMGMSLSGIYLLLLQTSLRKNIRRNHTALLDNFPETEP